MTNIAKRSSPGPAVKTGAKKDSVSNTVSGKDLMQSVMSRPRKLPNSDRTADVAFTGIIIGELSGQDAAGQPLVDYPGNPLSQPIVALATQVIDEKSANQPIALSFIGGDPEKPVILGFVHNPAADEVSQQDKLQEKAGRQARVVLDGDTMTLSAEQEIVLQCGKSSITLTRAGKIVIKGAYLSNYSTGVNRIKGGSVQIN